CGLHSRRAGVDDAYVRRLVPPRGLLDGAAATATYALSYTTLFRSRPGRPPAARGRPGSGTGRTRIARRTSSPPRVSRCGPGGRGSAPGTGPPRPPLSPPRSGLLRPRGQSGDLAVRALVAVHQPDLAVELGALVRAGERQRLGEKVPLTWNFVVDRRALLQ